MKYAICNEIFKDWTFRDAFKFISEAGYDGVEIAPYTLNDNAFEISVHQIIDAVQLADEFDLEIIGLHWLLARTNGLCLTTDDVAVRKKTAEYLTQLSDICNGLGGGVMVLGSPQQRLIADGMTVEQANQNAIACIQQVLPDLERNEVVLALEPLGPEEGNFLLTAEWGRQLLEELNSPSVQLHLDVKAMCTEAKEIPQIIAESKNHMVHFHANDPNRRGPGSGDVDFKPIIAALNEANYDGWISVEVFDESVEPKETATESIRYLKEVS